MDQKTLDDLHKKQIEMLSMIIAICEKLNLTYYLVGAGVIGAVKYKGFIPWDDDVDIALPRDDYEILIDKAQSMLPDNLFVQNFKTEKEFIYAFSQIRNRNTTYLDASMEMYRINHGIYIDIFPIDGLPKSRIMQRIFFLKKFMYTVLLALSRDRKKDLLYRKVLYYIYKVFGKYINYNRLLCRYDGFLRRYSIDQCDYMCIFTKKRGNKNISPKWHFGNGRYVEFENIKVRIPENFDAYLIQVYGDYNAEWPEEKRKGSHAYFIDLEKSYKEYMKGMRE